MAWAAGPAATANPLTLGHVALTNSLGVAKLLHSLRDARADSQVAALLARNPAGHVAVDYPDGVASLLYQLKEAGAEQQLVTLMDRLPAAGQFRLFLRKSRFLWGLEPDERPAKRWGWHDLD